MEDAKVGRIVRVLRRWRGWSQAYLGRRAGVSQGLISLIERGHAANCPIATIRRVLSALDGGVEIHVSWRGGELDRVLDQRHADLVGLTVVLLHRYEWLTELEVTYSHFGERGSIDILGWRPTARSLLVVETKSEIVSVEATLRKLDEKVRLAGPIGPERLGWPQGGGPLAIGRLIVLPGTRTEYRRVARHAALFGQACPTRGSAVRRWLRDPVGPMAGLLFVTDSNGARKPRDVDSGTGRRSGRLSAA
jgi:transcriptional regulator with XRE-family HTH domain